MALTLSYIELKRLDQALSAQKRAVELAIVKRQKMASGDYSLPGGKKFKVASLEAKNDEAEDKVIAIQSVQTKIREEMRRLEGAETASLRREFPSRIG